jgi:hypothetical protein
VIADCRLKIGGQVFKSTIKNQQSTMAQAREEVRGRRNGESSLPPAAST